MFRGWLLLVVLVGVWLAFSTGKITINGGYHFDYQGVQSSRNELGSIEPEVSRIVIENRFGDIQVVQQVDEAGWSWTGACWATEAEDADRFLEALQLRVVQSDTTQTWSVELPASDFRLRGVRSDLVVSVPASVEVVSRNRHGDSRIERITGPVDVKSRHGDAFLEDLAGAVTVDCEHGHVQANRLTSSATFDVEHGNTTIAQSEGELKIKSEHGDVSLDRVTAAVEARLEHGDLKAVGVEADVRFDSEHGKVDLKMAGDRFGEVVGKVRHSRVRIKLPVGCVPRIDVKLRHGRLQSEVASDAGSEQEIRIDGKHTDVDIELGE